MESDNSSALSGDEFLRNERMRCKDQSSDPCVALKSELIVNGRKYTRTQRASFILLGLLK